MRHVSFNLILAFRMQYLRLFVFDLATGLLLTPHNDFSSPFNCITYFGGQTRAETRGQQVGWPTYCVNNGTTKEYCVAMTCLSKFSIGEVRTIYFSPVTECKSFKTASHLRNAMRETIANGWEGLCHIKRAAARI
mmetsp:Transcript_10693/g.30082  ORF Transcript_10693/g.30082 Transcript_10693/m.30082 type:complete len:135 (-) Transcript_10693:424-828(-)